MGQAAPGTALDAFGQGGQPAAGAGADAGRQKLEQFVSDARDLTKMLDEKFSQYPDLAPEIKQIREILKTAATKVAKTSKLQTPSSDALPMGGGGQ